MKESGLNYFFEKIGIPQEDWAILYTFEEGAGNEIMNISGASGSYTGYINSISNFWSNPLSGTLSGNSVSISNAENLNGENWTQIFVYEKVSDNDCSIFDSRNNTSGYKIGINEFNRFYFENSSGTNHTVSSLNNIASKNIITVSYVPNSLSFGYYNFTQKKLEQETFNQNFDLQKSNIVNLFDGFTGYVDYYLYFNTLLSNSTLEQLISGFYNKKTGVYLPVDTYCQSAITGYQNITLTVTGVTGYRTTPSGGEGRDYYSGEFPTLSSTEVLTGIISTTTLVSGVSGEFCYPVTGAPVDLFDVQTGYARTFGMDRISVVFPIESEDILECSFNETPFLNIYNFNGFFAASGFLTEIVDSGNFNGFLNGLAIHISGLIFNNQYLVCKYSDVNDFLVYDIISGNKQFLGVSDPVSIEYTGQSIFLNGIKLISGKDFVSNGSTLTITGNNTGVSGVIFEYPISLSSTSGNLNSYSGTKFSRNGSVIYFNGIRQKNNYDYVEGALIDKLHGNSYNYLNNINIYNNNGNYWE